MEVRESEHATLDVSIEGKGALPVGVEQKGVCDVGADGGKGEERASVRSDSSLLNNLCRNGDDLASAREQPCLPSNREHIIWVGHSE